MLVLLFPAAARSGGAGVAGPGYRHGADPGPAAGAVTRTGNVFYVSGADNAAAMHLHAALGFQEIRRFASERPAAGVDALSQLTKTGHSAPDGARR